MKQKKREEINKNKKQAPSESTKKSVLVTFILLFPSLILASLVAFQSSIPIAALAVSLFFYQAILLKNFIDDYYKNLE